MLDKCFLMNQKWTASYLSLDWCCFGSHATHRLLKRREHFGGSLSNLSPFIPCDCLFKNWLDTQGWLDAEGLCSDACQCRLPLIPFLYPLTDMHLLWICLMIKTAVCLICTVHQQSDGTVLYQLNQQAMPGCQVDWLINVRTTVFSNSSWW